MKNTKNFILVGATLLFSALSTCAFAQTEKIEIDRMGEPALAPAPMGKQAPPPPPSLQVTMDQVRQKWDSLYILGNPAALAEAYAEVVFVTNRDQSSTAKTREQISNSLKTELTSGKYGAYSSKQTDASVQPDGTIRVKGTYEYWMSGDTTRTDTTNLRTGTYDRNVILVNGKYKIIRSNDQ